MAQNIRKIDFAPGIQKDRSPLASEPGWVNSQWIRFRGEKPESMGGYVAFTGAPDLAAAALASHQWVDLSGNKWLAFGLSNALKVVNSSGTITDITPAYKGTGFWNTASVTQVNGSTTYTVVVAVYNVDEVVSSGHGLATGDSVYLGFLGASKTVTVLDPFTFTYTGSSAGSTSTTTYDYVYYNVAFTASGITGWSLDNFGENLVAVPDGGALYQWSPTASTSELIKDGDFDASTNWTTGTNWSITTGSPGYAAYSGSVDTQALSQYIDGFLEPGELYKVQMDIATASTNFTVIVQAYSSTNVPMAYITPYATGATTYGTYYTYVRCPANPAALTQPFDQILITMEGDGSETYRVRNISIAKVSDAMIVPEAPNAIEAMFVDPNRFVVLLGTIDAGGTYNPLLVRWCDQEDLTDWYPAADNLAGELPLSTGVSLVNGLTTRGQNILFTESDCHSMQYTGDPGTVFVINPIASHCGLISRRAAVKDNTGGVYWWSNAGQFYRFLGGSVEPIPCTLLRDVVENTASSYLSKIHAGLNPAFSEIFFFYPDSRDSATDVTRYAKLNYLTGVWDSGAFVCTAWLPQGIYSYPIAVDGDGDIFFMENGNDANGGNLTTSVTSSYFDIEDGGNLAIIERIIPDFDDQQGNVRFDFNLKMYPNATPTTTSTYTAGTTTEKLDMIFTARQMQVVISSVADPTFWRLGAMRFDIRKSGSRR